MEGDRRGLTDRRPARGARQWRWPEAVLLLIAGLAVVRAVVLSVDVARRGVRGGVVHDPDAAAAVLGSLGVGTGLGLVAVLVLGAALGRGGGVGRDIRLRARGVWILIAACTSVVLKWVVELTALVLPQAGQEVPVGLLLCLKGAAVGAVGVPVLVLALLQSSRARGAGET